MYLSKHVEWNKFSKTTSLGFGDIPIIWFPCLCLITTAPPTTSPSDILFRYLLKHSSCLSFLSISCLSRNTCGRSHSLLRPYTPFLQAQQSKYLYIAPEYHFLSSWNLFLVTKFIKFFHPLKLRSFPMWHTYIVGKIACCHLIRVSKESYC